ncbi:MAG: prepilin-type N-terminal cleavage/methylation domain-containing protein [Oligoflexia bacterium]|nr:prepilin-type N-terminal cleavage/methylation domain-containing protein [Oligoflexia bacterium]
MTRPLASPAAHGTGGFTLLEVIVALGILGVIAALAFSALRGSLNARDFMEGEEEFSRSAGTALDRVSRDLELAYLTSNTSAIATYQTVFIGKDGNQLDELWFATLGHQRRFANSRECDQAEITLWTEPDPENSDASVLLIRESQRIDERPEADGPVMPLAHGVQRFDLRYLDPTTGEWTDDWDSTGADQPNRLPRAVEIVLVMLAPDPDDPEKMKPRSFVRTVQLAFASTLNHDAQFLNAQRATQ